MDLILILLCSRIGPNARQHAAALDNNQLVEGSDQQYFSCAHVKYQYTKYKKRDLSKLCCHHIAEELKQMLRPLRRRVLVLFLSNVY